MRIRSEDLYQVSLISLGLISAIFLGVFLYRELFPEYLMYQNVFVELEKFRSEYTGKPSADFKEAIKQIVIPDPKNGPETIDRCISCHVALDIPYFSPTKIAKDVNGNNIVDEHGFPVQIPNDDYIWKKLEEKIAELTDPEVNKQLEQQGQFSEVRRRLQDAKRYQSWKQVEVDGHTYDVTVALRMHPLIGKETHPFEFHPIENFGCTSCHNGNGRGLVTDRAHGALLDETYEESYEGPTPAFLEKDEKNDPIFSRLYNAKPGERLLFQISPILVGDLTQAKCVQCHRTSSSQVDEAMGHVQDLLLNQTKLVQSLKKDIQNNQSALVALFNLKKSIQSKGFQKTLEEWKKQSQNYNQLEEKRKHAEGEVAFLQEAAGESSQGIENRVINKINQNLAEIVGSLSLADALSEQLGGKESQADEVLQKFLADQRQKGVHPKGSLFAKEEALALAQATAAHIEDMQDPFTGIEKDQKALASITTDIDLLTSTYKRGRQLYFSQACYACHRIAGLARGGVGPELTQEGMRDTWFIKQSVVWPQADLPTSTMPNMKLDHDELEAIVTFLLAQRDDNKVTGQATFLKEVRAWEGGKKTDIEKPLPPSEVYNLRNSMTIFATEGCASCHRLKGFESNVGFRVEKQKEKPSFDEMYKEHLWFEQLFPEESLGSRIAETIEKHAKEIDQHIAEDVRKGSLLEEIEQKYPQAVEALYSNFRFASRAKNHLTDQLATKETDPKKKEQILEQKREWKERVHRVLMMYVQEYGLGRLIGPRLNWSGVFRTDEWLMEHFWKPTLHSPRSIMPVFSFDDSKFLALTHMLDELGIRNRQAEREVWDKRGFNPAVAVQVHCTQCHGDFLQGNGPVATWIYPIPKNLRNPTFLRNLTKARVIQSITHGVKGTPMPPWGEVALGKTGYPIFKENEIQQIVDWLFLQVPGEHIFHEEGEEPKWKYSPKDIIKDLEKEGGKLKSEETDLHSFLAHPEAQVFFASLTPVSAHPIENDKVKEIFDIKANPIPVPGVEKEAYYIKKKYYTKENIEAGKEFFEMNCAVCHGKEADGSGLRAENMYDAKPRMLINVDWLATRDDLRLLRSIKFGVPGTAMNPWGDLTTSLQRLQLVMYIRSLSVDQRHREELNSALYNTFVSMQLQIDQARMSEYAVLRKLDEEYIAMQGQLQKQSLNEEQGSIEKSAQLYEKQLKLNKQQKQQQKRDQHYQALLIKVKEEQDVYKSLGDSILNDPELAEKLLPEFLQMVTLNEGRFVIHDGKLQEVTIDKRKEIERKKLKEKMIEILDEKIAEADQEKKKSYSLLKDFLLSSFAKVEKLVPEESVLFHHLKQDGQDGKDK